MMFSLMMRELERARLDMLPKVVYEKEGFINKLDKANIDIIVADYNYMTGQMWMRLHHWRNAQARSILGEIDGKRVA